MRANEFVINIPIHITLNGDGTPEVSAGQPPDDNQVPLMIPPLQQELEMFKAINGKQSRAIDQLLDDE